MDPKKVQRFSRKHYWPYRAIAAGDLEGEKLSELMERETNPRVARQLAWNRYATTEQLDRLLELWTKHRTLNNEHARSEIFYAIANHENSSLRSRVMLQKYGWVLDYSDHSEAELLSVLREFSDDPKLETLPREELVRRLTHCRGVLS